MPLDDFEDAFTAASWDADRFAEAVQSFTYQVEHRLAEHRDALTSEAELRAELQQLRALVWHTPKRATSSNIMVTARHVRLPRRL